MTYAELVAAYAESYTLSDEAINDPGRRVNCADKACWCNGGSKLVLACRGVPSIPGTVTWDGRPADALIKGPDALTEGVGFNRSPELEAAQSALLAAALRAGKPGRLFLASEANAPNPCPACYTGEHGVPHSYTSACKESE